MFHGPTEVALDWLFDRIILDPMIQIRYIDSKHQHADILTTGNFHVMGGIIFFICSILAIPALFAAPKIFSLIGCTTMAKRLQERKKGERVVTKSRLVMNESSCVIATSSFASSSPIASKSPGMSGASGKPVAGCILKQVHSTQLQRLR